MVTKKRKRKFRVYRKHRHPLILKNRRLVCKLREYGFDARGEIYSILPASTKPKANACGGERNRPQIEIKLRIREYKRPFLGVYLHSTKAVEERRAKIKHLQQCGYAIVEFQTRATLEVIEKGIVDALKSLRR